MKTVIFVVVCLASFLALVGIVTSIIPENMRYSGALAAPVMFIVFLGPIGIAAWAVSHYDKSAAAVKKTLNHVSDEVRSKQEIRNSVAEFEDVRNEVKYISDETLLKDYEAMLKEQKESMRRLALEEELVKRKLIEYSPMHEKIYAIRKKFKI